MEFLCIPYFRDAALAMKVKNDPNSILLTPQEAIEAVCLDFHQYKPQILLFAEILRIVSNNELVALRERGKDGFWIRQGGQHRMHWFEGPELVQAMCEIIRRRNPDPPLIAALCARVFQTRAILDVNAETTRTGIRIFTGMEDFLCRQCGRCCRTLDYRSEITAEDVARWKQLGRKDILAWVGVFDKKDSEPVYRIWMKPGTREFADPCPFLFQSPVEEQRWFCRIHDVKPEICRQYPVSRKHGIMTGCRGFRHKKV